jgi:hypothetical protein
MTTPAHFDGLRLGVILDDEQLLGAGRRDDPLAVVVLRSTFLNPPRAGAARRMAERIRQRHPDVELVPYAWHYLTHEAGDGVVVGSNRSLDAKPGSYGHLRGDAGAQAWEITKICAGALEARRVLLRTPSSFSPGSLSRRRFESFLATLGPDDPKLVWEPEGLWTAAEAAAFAESQPHGVEILAPAFGMTGQLLEFDGATWLRIQGSKDGRLRSSHAEVLAYALTEHAAEQPLTLLFDGRRAYANLRAFVRALELAL